MFIGRMAPAAGVEEEEEEEGLLLGKIVSKYQLLLHKCRLQVAKHQLLLHSKQRLLAIR
jgi:hypothetical protein